MYKISVIFCIIFTIHISVLHSIPNGEITKQRIKYMAAIFINGNYKCGGSILREDLILTSAFCVRNVKDISQIPTITIKVKIGSKSINECNGNDYYIKKVIQHEKYTPSIDNFQYDVAIIVLKDPIDAPTTVWNTVSIARRNERVDVNKELTVRGWGVDGDKYQVKLLRESKISVRSPEYCSTHEANPLFSKYFNKHIMFCIGGDNRNNVACGDAGSPIMNENDKQVGIVSAVSCEQNTIGFYTKVFASYHTKITEDSLWKWIDQKRSAADPDVILW